MPVYRGDHRQRQLHERHEAALEKLVLHLPLRLRHAVPLFQVGASADKTFARAGQEDATRIARLCRQPGPEVVELAPHLRIERVQHFRAVEPHHQDAALRLEGERGVLAHRRSIRSDQAATIIRCMQTNERGRLSNWRDTAGVAAEQARELATRLEHRARATDEIAARESYLDLIAPAEGERVLDVGCGSGVLTRAIGRRVGDRGRVVGLDSSPALLDLARHYAEEAGAPSRVEWRAGDCRKLPLTDGSFDVVLAATVLAHVPGVDA